MSVSLPPMKTSGLMMAEDGSVYLYQPTNPNGFVQLSAAPGTQSIVMNAPVPVISGQVLDAGWWIMVSGPGTKRDNCQLVESDGAAAAPVTGDAYLLALAS